MGLFRDIVNGIKGVLGGVDELITSDEERRAIELKVTESLAPLLDKAMSFEMELLKARSEIILAETKSESFLTRNWRPFSMMVLLAYVVVGSLVGMEIDPNIWDLFQIGFGGYIGGRTVEKVAPEIVKAIKGNKNSK